MDRINKSNNYLRSMDITLSKEKRVKTLRNSVMNNKNL
jgi:hypothetical protein